MTGLEERETYLLAMAACSDRIVQAAHDEQPAAISEGVRQALAIVAPAGTDPVTALVGVLAAQVSPDLPITARLGWVRDVGIERPGAA